MAMRADYFASSRSAIVISGYGKHEYFPGIFDLHTEGILGGKLKLRTWINNRITHGNGAIVAPLAQTDMVHLFMYGVDREYQSFLEKSVPDLIHKVGRSIVDVYVKGSSRKRDKIKSGLTTTKAIRKVLESFWKQASEYRQKSITNDIIRTVQSLPKA